MRVLIKIQSSLKFMPVCAEISSHSNVSSEFQTNSMRVRIKTWPWSRFRAKIAESLWNSARSTRTAKIIVGETFFANSSFMEPTERAWFIICCYFKLGDFFFLLIPLSIIQFFMIPVGARVFVLRSLLEVIYFRLFMHVARSRWLACLKSISYTRVAGVCWRQCAIHPRSSLKQSCYAIFSAQDI